MSDSESVGSLTPKKSSKSKERYAEKIRGLPIIANPLASRRTTKHVLKLVRKGMYFILIIIIWDILSIIIYSIQRKGC